MAASVSRTATNDRPIVLHAFHLGTLDFDFHKAAHPLESPAFSMQIRPIENPFPPENPIVFDNPSYYLRLAVSECLPTLDRLIYLDVDLIVRSNLALLYDLDLGGKTFAAVPDATIADVRAKPAKTQSINMTSIVLRRYFESFMSDDEIYFNSGVLLIDLSQWRQKSIRAKAMEFLRTKYNVVCADQDALNYVAKGDVLFLDHGWNFTPALMAGNDRGHTLDSAHIVHFAGFKPWKTRDEPHSSDAFYWNFAQSTPYGKALRDIFRKEIRANVRAIRQRAAKCPTSLFKQWVRRLF